MERRGEDGYSNDKTYLQDDILCSSGEGDFTHYKVIFNKVEIKKNE